MSFFKFSSPVCNFGKLVNCNYIYKSFKDNSWMKDFIVNEDFWLKFILPSNSVHQFVILANWWTVIIYTIFKNKAWMKYFIVNKDFWLELSVSSNSVQQFLILALMLSCQKVYLNNIWKIIIEWKIILSTKTPG